MTTFTYPLTTDPVYANAWLALGIGVLAVAYTVGAIFVGPHERKRARHSTPR